MSWPLLWYVEFRRTSENSLCPYHAMHSLEPLVLLNSDLHNLTLGHPFSMSAVPRADEQCQAAFQHRGGMMAI